MTYIKRRSIPNLSNQIDRAQKASVKSQRDFSPVEGENNYWRPDTARALWFAICPNQQWSTSIYDKDEGRVVDLENYLYYAYVLHVISANRRFQRVICSAGAHKDKPCWGCGVRNAFFDRRDAEKARTGVEPKGEPPVSASTQYAFAGVVLEHHARVAKLRDNKPITTKEGKPIMEDLPLMALPAEEARRLKNEGATTFGRAVHWSMGREVLGQVKNFNEQLKNYCANCAEPLYATEVACPECETVHVPVHSNLDEGLPLVEESLTEVRGQKLRCSKCRYQGPMLPIVQCECGNPLEGALQDFAIRIKATRPTEKTTILSFSEVKPIRYFTEKYPAVEELLNNPLDLNAIFKPTSLRLQTFRIPDHLRGDGVTPEPRRKQNADAVAEPYPLGRDDDDNTDDNEFEA